MKYSRPLQSLKVFASTLGVFVLSTTQSLAQELDRVPESSILNNNPNGNTEIAPIKNYGVTAKLTDYGEAVSGVSFVYYLVFIWRALIFIAGLVVLVALVTGAIEWIGAGGDKGKIEKAREKMTQAVIGFVVLVGLLAITQFLQVVLGINLLSPDIPTVNDARFFAE